MRAMSDEVKAQKRFRKEWDEVCAMIRLNSTKEWREKVYLVPNQWNTLELTMKKDMVRRVD